MFDRFLEDHLRSLPHGQTALLVYKGFPTEFLLSHIAPKIPRMFDGDYLTTTGVDLGRLENSVKRLTAAFLNLDSGLSWATYEEFIALSTTLLDPADSFDGDIIVVDNNFFHNAYPYEFVGINAETVAQFVEYQNSDKEQDPPEHLSLLFKYFGAVEHRLGRYYVSFVDKTEPGTRIKVEPYFRGYPLIRREEVSARNEGSSNHVYVFPDPLSERFPRLKLDLYQSLLGGVDEIQVVLESSVFTNDSLLDEISLVRAVCERLGLRVWLYLKQPSFVQEHRPNFLPILRRYWGADADFRLLHFYRDPDTSTDQIQISQGALIEDIVSQCERAARGEAFRDLFITAPTGSGKSLLFQLPAIYLAEQSGFVTIVVTPLKALMYDQVQALRKRGISYAAYINSDLTLHEREQVLGAIRDGGISIVYLSPELLLSNDIRTFVGHRPVGLLVIDEAHLVTTWGRDFRVDYWYLGTYIDRLRRYNVLEKKFPVLALTATAVYQGPDDMVLETIVSLSMQNPKIYLGTVRRDEILFEVQPFSYKGSYEDEKMQHTIRRIIHNIASGIKTIVYFPWVRQIEEALNLIDVKYKDKVGTYYGSMDGAVKEELASQFKRGEKMVMLATKAFGMGIDISDIQEVYHHAPSGNLCDYVQEVGRVARSPQVQGRARIDFNPRDLKYTRILYGLSAIRQYQLRLLLQKLYDIYRMHRRQNFLVSPESFRLIFGGAADIDQKVKSGLLLIEKDLHARYGYPVVVVRPRSLFSKSYACIPSEIEAEVLGSRYGKAFTKVYDVSSNRRTNSRNVVTTDLGNIYEVDLKHVWETYFSNLSFPQLKHKFHQLELFEFSKPVYPRYRFRLELRQSPDQTKERLRAWLETLGEIFAEMSGRYFTRSEFTQAVRRRVGNETTSRRIANVILDLFVITTSWGETGTNPVRFGQFIQSRIQGGTEEKFRLISHSYRSVQHTILREADILFSQMQGQEFLRYIGGTDQPTNNTLKVAYLLEAFQLGSYEISGGKDPEIFIRINDPYKVRILVEGREYHNKLLADIDNRHRRSIELMEYFFTAEMTNKERWDLIERYFLGHEVGIHATVQ